MSDIERSRSSSTRASRRSRALREQGREAAARRRAPARRDEDGQGLRRGEAQAPARRQDGGPPRQQGRDLAHHAGRGHAASRGRHAGRSRAQPARRAEPHDVGQILETHLGWASAALGRQVADMLDKVQKSGKVGELRKFLQTIYGKEQIKEDGEDLDDRGVVELGPQPEERHPDGDAGVRRCTRGRHQRHARHGGAGALRPGAAGRRTDGRVFRPLGHRRLHLHAEAAPPGG